ncbi:DUF3089 domain-containing protein [Algimonas porphyrae]|uniref:DUF3089 domain-containing protein n=1 Tax=Algimonas porphyrae TaxID=1128113 RepID=A0ABQ5UXI5_9PROT|nr:DUF3089 domain-containing protein [Algimonas porphyrae]GLQ19109.1 hypothetical protein GCM10007854_00640 [Algimonas porphyrae]
MSAASQSTSRFAFWQIILGGVVATLIIAGTLAWIYRDDIFQTIQDPRQPFQTYDPPDAPNYALADSWLSQPDLSVDPYTLDVPGDVFVVVPSVYRGGEHYVLPSDDLRRKNKLERIVRPNYVVPYGDAGRLFAPFYRQASLYSYMTTREDARLAQDFAYQDVKRAFRVFLTQSPPERPIVLAGHNQGASHLIRLLHDFFAQDEALRARLAVAYVIDYPLPEDLFDQSLAPLTPCETASDTNCVAAFGMVMPGEDGIADRFTERLLVHDGDGFQSVSGRSLVCINPLTWTRSEDYAPERLHLGGVAAEGLEPDIRPAARPNQVGAQCQDGVLLVDKPRSRSLRRPIQIGAKFRTLPSNLFYEDLRQNALQRVTALVETGSLPKRVQRLDELSVIDVDDSPVVPAQDRPPTSQFPDADKR